MELANITVKRTASFSTAVVHSRPSVCFGAHLSYDIDLPEISQLYWKEFAAAL